MDILDPFITFLIAFLRVVIAALAIGFIPGMIVLAKHRRTKLLVIWSILWALCVGGTVYGIPLGQEAWRFHLKKFRPQPMYLGYGIGIMGAFFAFPEPLRQARLRTHNDGHRNRDDGSREHKRRSHRKKRRTHNYEV